MKFPFISPGQVIWNEGLAGSRLKSSAPPKTKWADRLMRELSPCETSDLFRDLSAPFASSPETAQMEWSGIYQQRLHITGTIAPVKKELIPGSPGSGCTVVRSFFYNAARLEESGESRYADEMERALFNALWAIPLPGEPNQARGLQLEAESKETPQLPPCCLESAAGLMSELGRYFFSIQGAELGVHFFGACAATFEIDGHSVKIRQTTDYPWKPRVQLSLEMSSQVAFQLRVRLPGWCREGGLWINGNPVEADLVNGYISVHRTWNPGDMVDLHLAMPTERMHPHPELLELSGRVALQRGPVVYCLEGLDHEVDLESIVLPPPAELVALHEKKFLGGVTTLHTEAWRPSPVNWDHQLYRVQRCAYKPTSLKAIPYFAWGLRGPTQMRVWLREP